MTVSIEYSSKLKSNNNNIVIFVSSLSQLKNIEILPNIEFYLNQKEFLNQFKSNKYILMTNLKTSDNYLANIMIMLVEFSVPNSLKYGQLIHSNFLFFQKDFLQNLTFIFSQQIKTNFKNIIANIVFSFCLKFYNFDKYKYLTDNINKKIKLNLFQIRQDKELKYKLNLIEAINYSKDLVSEPANILNPKTFAKKCLNLKKIGLKIQVLNLNQIKKIGMRSLIGVSLGSENEPKVVLLEWNLKKNIKPTVLVGKGVTFDSGGISIKPSSGMEEMITDMGGSAVVVGSLINAALNNLSHSLVGIIGLVENMPDGKAQRPGDIVNSLSNQTIEIINTDAEGRLILADIITYIQNKYNSKQIIDFATLTGAIMIALGTHKAGLFSNSDILSKKLEIAGEISQERLWRLPLGDEYDDEINSSRADMKNIGSTRYGGSIHAAQFIHRFVKNNTPWAHIDIAGVSWTKKSGQNSISKLNSPGATAFGIRLIDQFLKGK